MGYIPLQITPDCLNSPHSSPLSMNKVQSKHHGSGTLPNEHGNPKQSQIASTAYGRKHQRDGDEKYLGT